jgi:Ring finger domain
MAGIVIDFPGDYLITPTWRIQLHSLKQKFEHRDSLGSFRIRQSSSTRILNDANENENGDEESNPAVPSCAICLDPFQDGEDVCSAQNTQCTHEFHLTCIFPWLLKSQECPCCRRDYLSPVRETDASGRLTQSEPVAARTGN